MKKANNDKYSIKVIEYLRTARRMFLERGYENTSVKNIIDELGVAKGTFYHYFPSKEALLDALISDFTDQFRDKVAELVNREDLNSLEKLNSYFRINREIKKSNPELMMIFLKAMHNNSNILFRHKMHKTGVEKILPEFLKILKQGAAENIFNMDDPEETAEILISIGTTYLDSTGPLMMRIAEEPELIDVIEKKLLAYESSFARLLGIDKKHLKIIEPGFIEAFRGAGNG